MATKQRMTYDDLMAITDDSCRHELVRGEIVRVPYGTLEHGRVMAALVGEIGRYLDERARALGWDEGDRRRSRDGLVGCLLCGGSGIRFSLPDDPDQVRGVDVLYLTPRQFARAASAFEHDEYIAEVPALVVEVVSPFDTAEYINEKVLDYLAGGAKLVWVLYPKTHMVHVYKPSGFGHIVQGEDMLNGGDVLPGFSVSLKALFA